MEEALRHVYGYAVGVDLTRRDLQNAAKRAAGDRATRVFSARVP